MPLSEEDTNNVKVYAARTESDSAMGHLQIPGAACAAPLWLAIAATPDSALGRAAPRQAV